MVIVQLALPAFNQLTGKVIVLERTGVLFLGVALAGIAVITGILAGSYPAFYLSSFQPAQVLKGKAVLSHSSGWLRQSLVVFQFMIAIALVCGMLIISDQLNFMQEKNLGFDARAKVVLPLRTRSARNAYPALNSELAKNSGIASVSAANYVPGSPIWSDMLFYPEGGNMETAVMIRRNSVDAGYLELMDIKLIAGRSFSDNRALESARKVIVNRASVKKLGLTTEEIVGRLLHFDWHGEHYAYEVIGVMEDYHQVSLKEEITPTLFEISSVENQYSFIVASINTDNFSTTLAEIEAAWKRSINDTPFEYSFLDESLQKQYDEDRKVSSIITSFTVIAMAICCLGLYGLSSFMAERRFKEIGIRKVMGASLSQIASMMSREFVKLVLVAFVISAPIAWYAMDKWLEGFAYHAPVNIWIFAYAGTAALVIALATVSFESLKAASANPVNSLRNE